MVLHPTHFIRNIDPVSLDVCEDEKLELLTLDPRTGTALSANNSCDNSNSVSSSASAAVSEGKSRKGWGYIGEILWIIRPVIYGMYSSDKESFIALLIFS
jgi:peroxin-16